MDSERKKIIIKEIQYWKQHKLLPETYCNFLLTLYLEGTDEENIASNQINLTQLWKTFLLVLLFFITVVVIYFTDFSFVMQIGFALLALLITIFIAKKTLNSHSSLGHFYFIMGAILLFIIMSEATTIIFPENRSAIIGTIIITCIGWVVIGLKWRVKYFLFSGIIGIVLLLVYLTI